MAGVRRVNEDILEIWLADFNQSVKELGDQYQKPDTAGTLKQKR
tara:strand:+ start:128 stop:259 length:132 start_codon:yes stop_codon:yes gene_type:complete